MNELYRARYNEMDYILKCDEGFLKAYQNDPIVHKAIQGYMHGSEVLTLQVALIELASAQSQINKDLRDTLVKKMCFESVTMIIKNP